MSGGVTNGEHLDPYNLGRAIGASDCPVDNLYDAIESMTEKSAAAEDAFNTYLKKTFCSEKKIDKLEHEYLDLRNAPADLRKGLRDGAFEAFLDARPEHLQEILANPKTFVTDENRVNAIASGMLIKLVSKVPNPAVIDIALAKADSVWKKDLISIALSRTVEQPDRSIDVNSVISCFIDAGAKVSSGLLSIALEVGLPAAAIDTLEKNGGNFEEAVESLRDSEFTNFNKLPAVEFAAYRHETDARIQDLEETVRELTEKKPSAKAPRPKKAAPAKKAGL